MSASDDLIRELADMGSNAEPAERMWNAYAGPVADHIARLERKIDGLEQALCDRLPAQPARVEAGPMAIDTRPGLSVPEVEALIRASRS